MCLPRKIARKKLPNHCCVVGAPSLRRPKTLLIENVSDLAARVSLRSQFENAFHQTIIIDQLIIFGDWPGLLVLTFKPTSPLNRHIDTF